MEQKFAIKLRDENNNIAVLACELDNEDFWEETGENEFTNTILKDVSVLIIEKDGSAEYIYDIQHNDRYNIQLINIEDNTELTEEFTVQQFMDSAKEYDFMKNTSRHKDSSWYSFKTDIFNRRIKIKMYKLLTLRSVRYSLTISISSI